MALGKGTNKLQVVLIGGKTIKMYYESEEEFLKAKEYMSNAINEHNVIIAHDDLIINSNNILFIEGIE